MLVHFCGFCFVSFLSIVYGQRHGLGNTSASSSEIFVCSLLKSMGVEVSSAVLSDNITATHSAAWCTQHSLYLSIVFLQKSRMWLHNNDTAYLCSANLFLLVGTKCKQRASKCGDFTDPAWTLATELQWYPALCQNKRWHHSWCVSEWDLNSGLNVCATDPQHPLLCYCLFGYVFLQLLSLVSQRLIILSGASQNWSFLLPCLSVDFLFCWNTTFSVEITQLLHSSVSV